MITTVDQRDRVRAAVCDREYHIVGKEHLRPVTVVLEDIDGEKAPVQGVLTSDGARELARDLNQLADDLDAGYYATGPMTVPIPAEHVAPMRELLAAQHVAFEETATGIADEHTYYRYLHVADAAWEASEQLAKAPAGQATVLSGPAGLIRYLLDNWVVDRVDDRHEAAMAARRAMNGEMEDAA